MHDPRTVAFTDEIGTVDDAEGVRLVFEEGEERLVTKSQQILATQDVQCRSILFRLLNIFGYIFFSDDLSIKIDKDATALRGLVFNKDNP